MLSGLLFLIFPTVHPACAHARCTQPLLLYLKFPAHTLSLTGRALLSSNIADMHLHFILEQQKDGGKQSTLLSLAQGLRSWQLSEWLSFECVFPCWVLVNLPSSSKNNLHKCPLRRHHRSEVTSHKTSLCVIDVEFGLSASCQKDF